MSENYIWNLKDLGNVKKNGLKVFSCFSCGGGSTMGYKLAGFEVIGNNEIDPKMNKLYLKNHNPKYNFCCDIREMINKKIPQEFYDIDILDGSPPCSVFSMVGLREKAWDKEKEFREGQEKQRLDDLFIHFLNFAEKIKPKVIIAENVKGLIQKNAKGYVNEILKKFDQIGYDTQMFLLNSAKMGVPQARSRVFFIARRKNMQILKIKLQFNEKPIKYGEFKDKNFKPINKNTQIYDYWQQRNKKDNMLCDAIMRAGGKRKRYSCKFIHDERIAPTITANSEFLRFDVPGTLSNKDFIIRSFIEDKRRPTRDVIAAIEGETAIVRARTELIKAIEQTAGASHEVARSKAAGIVGNIRVRYPRIAKTSVCEPRHVRAILDEIGEEIQKTMDQARMAAGALGGSHGGAGER